MPFFALPYRVLFHDTMAYGTHHFMTNFRFQNLARETALFTSTVDGRSVWKEQLKDLLLLTREAYSLNFAPVALGQKVAILLTYEEPTRSTFRLCFRVIREDGAPVSCGYQTMVCLDKNNQEPAPAPEMLTQYLRADSEDNLLEQLKGPSFAERLKRGGSVAKEIFTDELRRLAVRLATAPEQESYPRIVDAASVSRAPRIEQTLPEVSSGVVFTFPGQGSYDPAVLRALHEQFPALRPFFAHADATCRRLLGHAFLPAVLEPVVDGSSPREAGLEVAQIGIYLAGALTGRLLVERGVRPDLLLGHSVGEFAALATGGAISIETGVELMCERVLSLRGALEQGAMAAAACSVERTTELLGQLGEHALEISVINHPAQTVVSGPLADLKRLQGLASASGTPLTLLASSYPFHSSHLAQCIERFREALRAVRFEPARIPVYHCTEQRLYAPDDGVPDILAHQFVRQLDFQAILRSFVAAGYTRFIECGAGNTLTKIVGKNFTSAGQLRAVASAPNAAKLQTSLQGIVDELVPGHTPQVVEEAKLEPIAIVAQGCVLPAAADPDSYWQNILNGVSGIVDAAELDPYARRDFMAGSAVPLEVVSDKTYTLLNGTIEHIRYDAAALGQYVTEHEFGQLTRAQRLLSVALGQLRSSGLRVPGDSSRVACFLGSTADGSGEHDNALFVESLAADLAGIEAPPAGKATLLRLAASAFGVAETTADASTQYQAYQDVLRRFVPGELGQYFVVDTACSSSLYAVDLAAKALRRRDADLVLAGGVFSPGAANSTLFAQFGGLSARQSRPFDKAADGVVFSDGSALLALKRLSDAIADGDRVLAVIRGIGLSSDGKSPAINVPQSKGQILAVRRALDQAGVEPQTIQYVEAHATATPVGDKVEVGALQHVFAGREASQPLELGSVKALIGHTGWVSGAASIIKLCKAFEAKTIPKQWNYAEPNPEIDLAKSNFAIPLDSHEWPSNQRGLPRRAGINGFGFGGTNAHLVLEEFDLAFHRTLSARFKPSQKVGLVLVGVGGLAAASNGHAPRLPKGKLVLPDVLESMDVSQFWAASAAEEALQSVEGWQSLRDRIAVVVGLSGRTRRGTEANKRVLLDRLQRCVSEAAAGLEPARSAEVDETLRALTRHIRSEVRPSGPYTLPGLMPNITASRVANLFDLHGPNIVVDASGWSLLRSLSVAQGLLTQDDCDLVLVGAADAHRFGELRDAAGGCVLAITRPEVAKAHNITVLAALELDAADVVPAGSSGVGESALDAGRSSVLALREVWQTLERRAGTATIPFRARGHRPHSLTIALAGAKPESSAEHGTHSFVQATPIGCYGPELVAEGLHVQPAQLARRKLLFLTDQPEQWAALRASGVLDGLTHGVVFPASLAVAGERSIDLTNDASLQSSLRALDDLDFDTIVPLQLLAQQRPEAVLTELQSRALLDLLFAICRRDYDRIGRGECAVMGLSCGALRRDAPLPATGLISGFTRSLARELPHAVIGLVATDEAPSSQALARLALELGRESGPRESYYIEGTRHVYQLQRLERLATEGAPLIDRDSVVVATGGARGVTAVLTKELLSRFGATVLALGRTDLDACPAALRELTPQAFSAYEATFYKQELAQNPQQKLGELRRRYASYGAANELANELGAMKALGGRFEYVQADITDAAATEQFIAGVYQRYGKIDLVLHGAGVQLSGRLSKKSLKDFRSIVDTKLSGLGNLYSAIQRRCEGRPVHYHLLSSAFSYLGNDGQPDYGAANQTLDRLALSMDDGAAGRWSSIAWLGWAGIGMTRGSEFAALAANRGLRGVTAEEGGQLFADSMAGPPAARVNVLLCAGEIAHYKPVIAASSARISMPAQPKQLAGEAESHWHVTLENAPFLRHHLVRGTPTMPQAFMTCIAGQAAQRLRPDLKLVACENGNALRFVRVPADRGAEIRAQAEVVSEGPAGVLVRVRLLTDFVHKSGMTLQKDILNNEQFFRMAPALETPPAVQRPAADAARVVLPDPYTLPGAVVSLNGQFKSMRKIAVGSADRIADYLLADSRYPDAEYNYLLPSMILIDAFWRFGTIRLVSEGTMAVYVPEHYELMRLHFDLMDFASQDLLVRMVFCGQNARPDGELLHVGPLQAATLQGQVMLTLDSGTCRKFGELDLRERELRSSL